MKTIAMSPFGKNSRKGVGRKMLMFLLWKYKGRCFYCRKKTIVPASNSEATHFEPLLSTGDHVYHRWDIRRALSEKLVLACQQCNKNNNDLFQHNLNKGFAGLEINLITFLK